VRPYNQLPDPWINLFFNKLKYRNYLELCLPHVPCRECKKFTIIQNVDNDQKFYMKVLELWNCEKEKKDKSLYEKIKAPLVGNK
jgi:hypothetical protein